MLRLRESQNAKTMVLELDTLLNVHTPLYYISIICVNCSDREMCFVLFSSPLNKNNFGNGGCAITADDCQCHCFLRLSQPPHDNYGPFHSLYCCGHFLLPTTMVSRSLLLELAIKRSTEALQHLVFRLKALALVSRWPAQVSFSIFLRLRNLLNQCLDHNRDGYGKSRSGSHESWSYHGRPNSPAYPSTLPTLETVLHDPLRTASLDTVPESSPTAALSEASSIEQISMVSISSQISNQNSVHDQNSMRTSLDKRGLVCVTPREYERYSRKKL